MVVYNFSMQGKNRETHITARLSSVGLLFLLFIFCLSGARQLPDMTRTLPDDAPVDNLIDTPADTPVALYAPSIKLVAPVEPLGLVSGTNQIDTPTDVGRAGWFTKSARPSGSEAGAVFIDGHTPGVFANLTALRPGDQLLLETADTTRYHYAVRAVVTAENSTIDLAALLRTYQGAPTLTLMTCAGVYQEAIGTYDHRTIVIATR